MSLFPNQLLSRSRDRLAVAPGTLLGTLLSLLVGCAQEGAAPAQSQDDLSGFDNSVQMFTWTRAPHSVVIRYYLEDAIQKSRPGSSVVRIVCREKPYFLSGTKDSSKNPDHVILVRMGAVFHTELELKNPDGEFAKMSGFSTLVCQNLDQPQSHRIRCNSRRMAISRN